MSRAVEFTSNPAFDTAVSLRGSPPRWRRRTRRSCDGWARLRAFVGPRGRYLLNRRLDLLEQQPRPAVRRQLPRSVSAIATIWPLSASTGRCSLRQARRRAGRAFPTAIRPRRTPIRPRPWHWMILWVADARASACRLTISRTAPTDHRFGSPRRHRTHRAARGQRVGQAQLHDGPAQRILNSGAGRLIGASGHNPAPDDRLIRALRDGGGARRRPGQPASRRLYRAPARR